MIAQSVHSGSFNFQFFSSFFSFFFLCCFQFVHLFDTKIRRRIFFFSLSFDPFGIRYMCNRSRNDYIPETYAIRPELKIEIVGKIKQRLTNFSLISVFFFFFVYIFQFSVSCAFSLALNGICVKMNARAKQWFWSTVWRGKLFCTDSIESH